MWSATELCNVITDRFLLQKILTEHIRICAHNVVLLRRIYIGWACGYRRSLWKSPCDCWNAVGDRNMQRSKEQSSLRKTKKNTKIFSLVVDSESIEKKQCYSKVHGRRPEDTFVSCSITYSFRCTAIQLKNTMLLEVHGLVRRGTPPPYFFFLFLSSGTQNPQVNRGKMSSPL